MKSMCFNFLLSGIYIAGGGVYFYYSKAILSLGFIMIGLAFGMLGVLGLRDF